MSHPVIVAGWFHSLVTPELEMVHLGINRCLRARQTSLLLLENRSLDARADWQLDGGCVTLANHEHVADTCGKLIALIVAQVDNVEGAWVAVTVHKRAHAAGVTTLGHHAHVASLELEVVQHLAGGQVNLDGVMDLDVWVSVADGAPVVRHNVWHSLGRQRLLHNTAQLEL
jgi:hypothetical protein